MCSETLVFITLSFLYIYINFEGYHGILKLDGVDVDENITISNNYIDGIGITRYWATGATYTNLKMLF